MRVKEIDRTANIAWSPEQNYPVYVAAGTAAQQLDATFSTSSTIELYSLSLDEATLDMPVVSSVESDARFHKVVWGPIKDTESGLIVTGGENGNISIYSADQMLKGSQDCLTSKLTQHVGAVKALDFNPFQQNLLASGAADSEIYIWDLLKTDAPMTPGQKSLPVEEVACLAWNCQVQHILGSTFASRCVVWDLRKNEPIIKVSDSMSRIKAKLLAWHPEVATQLCLSSEDDHTPVIQVWDLRYATSPLKVLENHHKGVLSIAWCHKDPDLLLSCGKDSRILCWNPNSNVPNGEVVYDLSTNNQWCFDIQWCPRNPSIISSSSFDGHITLYSLLGGGHPIRPSNKVADAFGEGQFNQVPINVPHEEEKVMPLQKPPKWIRRPVRATFSFGGKLVSFGLEKPGQSQQPVARYVTISQVVTETDLVVRSNQLEQALTTGQMLQFCNLKAANSSDPMQESVWNFIKVNFESEPRTKFLQLLGYDQQELARKVVEHTGALVPATSSRGVDAQELADKMSQLNVASAIKPDRLAAGRVSPLVGSKTPDELGDGSSAFDEIVGSGSTDRLSGTATPLVIPTDNADGLMIQALLTGNFEAAVEMCLSQNRMAEAILLAIAGGPELLIKTQKKYFQKNKSTLGKLISSIVTHDWSYIVQSCDLDNWKEALAVVLTYANSEEFSSLCDTLANRLETERNGELSIYASLCYICSGNVDKLVENWIHNTEDSNKPLALQDMVEKVMILRKAVELTRGAAPVVSSGVLADKLSKYADNLAAQGSLATALTYLTNTKDTNLIVLQDRLSKALGLSVGDRLFPFPQVNILPEGAVQNVSQRQQPAQVSTRNAASRAGGAPHQSGQQPTFEARANTVAASGSDSYYQQHNKSLAAASTEEYYQQQNKSAAAASTDGYYQQQNKSAAATSTDGYYQQQNKYNQPQLGAPLQPNQPSPAAPSAHKGLSHKYPHNPAALSAYGVDTISGQNYNQYANPMQLYNSNPASYNTTPTNPASYYNPTNAMGSGSQMYTPPAVPATPANSPQVPIMYSYQDKPAETAWNDPPIIQEKARHAPQSSNYPAANLLTPHQTTSDLGPPGAPLYPGLYNPADHQPSLQPVPQQSYTGPVQQQSYSGPVQQQSYTGPVQQQSYTGTVQQSYPGSVPQTYSGSGDGVLHQAPQNKPVSEPPKPKGPIAPEHQILQDIFDKLVKLCAQIAPNAQMKRKLEDVSRKLELLYDKLRENLLSLNVLDGLHQIATAVQQCDYNSGLAAYTSMVSHGNFSEISNFMPAIKVLLQSAAQMQVYLQ